MASDDGLVAWLRAVIEGDRDDAAHRLRLSRMSAAHRALLMEKAARANAELAILVEHHGEDTAGGQVICHRCSDRNSDHPDIQDLWVAIAAPCRTVRLLGYGYRHRPGYREEWAIPGCTS